ncbi:hypothetical protein C162_21863 [Paenibacillus sp. FSL R7-269]|uniref:hypothetical protein n=1 Tax=Paenibacillus sp. FSL R7-269 TaxID=1226755 RepID=UPI0003E209FC|nr:hypothetical protein [Paenibacillus sp. FSL R7-269]ETT45227.1 hypothetical protein C162_21863 [Paenibacillus sp. FSL R7-269]
MAKKHYHVTAEFVDKETGETILPGSVFEADDERLVLLRAAEVVGKEATKAEVEAALKAGNDDADNVKTG